MTRVTTLEGQRVGILASRPIKSLSRGEARAEAHRHSEDGKAQHIYLVEGAISKRDDVSQIFDTLDLVNAQTPPTFLNPTPPHEPSTKKYS